MAWDVIVFLKRLRKGSMTFNLFPSFFGLQNSLCESEARFGTELAQMQSLVATWRSSCPRSGLTWSDRARSTRCNWTSRPGWRVRSPHVGTFWRLRTVSMEPDVVCVNIMCKSRDLLLGMTQKEGWHCRPHLWGQTCYPVSLVGCLDVEEGVQGLCSSCCPFCGPCYAPRC